MASPRAKFSLWRLSGYRRGRSNERPSFITGFRAGFRPVTGREPFTPQYLSSGFPLPRDSRATPPHRQNFHSVALFGKWTGSPNGRLYGSVCTLSSGQRAPAKSDSRVSRSRKTDSSNVASDDERGDPFRRGRPFACCFVARSRETTPRRLRLLRHRRPQRPRLSGSGRVPGPR
jgi:hypothetical protein